MRALICVALLCQFCSAQSIRVRVLNSNDGHPLPKQAVTVQFLYETPAKATPPLHIETDANGDATFSVPEPTPEHVNVRVTLSSEHWHCACWALADTQKIFKGGITQPAAVKQSNAATTRATAEPGEIVFLVRPFTFFERLLYPFVKE
jgi:hypothetical protein